MSKIRKIINGLEFQKKNKNINVQQDVLDCLRFKNFIENSKIYPGYFFSNLMI
jgi:hypothetical protein